MVARSTVFGLAIIIQKKGVVDPYEKEPVYSMRFAMHPDRSADLLQGELV